MRTEGIYSESTSDKEALTAWIVENIHAEEFEIPFVVAFYDVDYAKNIKGRGSFKLYLGYLLDKTYQRRRLSISSIESSFLTSSSHLTPPPRLCHGACLHARGHVHLHEGVDVRALQGAIYYVLIVHVVIFVAFIRPPLLTYYISRFRAFWNFTSASGLVRDLPSFW